MADAGFVSGEAGYPATDRSARKANSFFICQAEAMRGGVTCLCKTKYFGATCPNYGDHVARKQPFAFRTFNESRRH